MTPCNMLGEKKKDVCKGKKKKLEKIKKEASLTQYNCTSVRHPRDAVKWSDTSEMLEKTLWRGKKKTSLGKEGKIFSRV